MDYATTSDLTTKNAPERTETQIHTSSCLKESKQKVNKKNRSIAERDRKMNDIQPNQAIDKEQANARSKQTNGQNRSGVESVAQFAIDNVTSRVSGHENSVHFRQQQRRIASRVLQLLFDGGIAFSRKVSHEIAAKGNEKSPSINDRNANVWLR